MRHFPLAARLVRRDATQTSWGKHSRLPRRGGSQYVFSVDVGESLVARASWRMDSWSTAFFFMDTLVRELLNALPFSPPWRAPLCTPLERGCIELWDIETARFSVASCDASQQRCRVANSLKPVREATLKRPVTDCAFLFTPAEAGCKERPAGSGPRETECCGDRGRSGLWDTACRAHVFSVIRSGGRECPPHHEAPPLATLNTYQTRPPTQGYRVPS